MTDYIRVGTEPKLRATVKEDGSAINISSGSTTFDLSDPGGIAVNYAGTFDSDGSDGKAYYKPADDTILDEAGWWEIQCIYTDGSSDVWPGEIYRFEVKANLS